MKTLFYIISIALLVLTIPVMSVAGKIYTWIDEKGVTHITETPPPVGGKLDSVMEYQPQTPAQETEIQEKLEGMRNQSERESLLAAVEKAKRDANEAQKRANEAQARIAQEQANLEEYKMKFANTTDRKRRFRFEIQKREMQVLDAKEAALRAAEDARKAESRVAQAQARVSEFDSAQSADTTGNLR